MFNWFICDGEFAQIMSNHLCFDFDLVKGFAVVDSHNRANHLRGYNHIPEMCSDSFWFFSLWTRPLGFPELFDEGHWFALEPTGKPPASPAVNKLGKFSTGHIKKFVKVNTSVRILLEGTLLSNFSVSHVSSAST